MRNIFVVFALIFAMTSAFVAEARPDHHRRGGYHGGHHGRGHYRPAPPPRYAPPVYNRGYNPGYGHRPVLRYPYRTLAWGALLSMFAYHQFQAPPPQMQWACFASSNGFYGNGFGFNAVEAQQNALLSCGGACMDGSYEMNCAPRY